jgi:hypothetical protein
MQFATSLMLLACAGLMNAAEPLRVAVFRADATPPLGEPLIWTTPTTSVDDPLWAKGIVLEDGRNRYVICTLDWCGLSNRSHQLFRAKLAKAAGIDVSHTAVQTLHQHTAPYVDGDAYALLESMKLPVVRYTDAALEQLADRVAAAVRKAVTELQPFDSIGSGEARVERVASARRLLAPDGKVITRYSGDGKKPAMAAAPEGRIDPLVKTVTLARGDKPIVRLHYYATHPQTWCCDGRVSADAVGAAREKLEREEKVFQIYFTGCSGDVTVGKYNDVSDSARDGISQRLLEGMKNSAAATKWSPAKNLGWQTVPLDLPKKLRTSAEIDARVAAITQDAPEAIRYKTAIEVAFARRTQPLEISMLSLGPVRILHLPGEPMLEFQLFAQSLSAGRFVAVAGYGDISPGYICTDRAHLEGGYEPSASNSSAGAEAVVKNALRKLLKPDVD